jgi:putative SOS response-associated peptidase YedK
MCGRYVLALEGIALADALHRRFGVERDLPQVPNTYNVARTQQLPVVLAGEDSRRHVELMRWNLIPRWQKPGAKEFNTINARAETVAIKPTFRHLIASHRCLVPASGFYEWQVDDTGARDPFYFSLQQEPLFAFAGLWEEWHNRDVPDGPPIRSYTILTTEANAVVAPIHDRMPVILKHSDEAEWLSPEVTDPAQVERLYQPYPAHAMQRWPVSQAVNSTRRNGAELILNSQ